MWFNEKGYGIWVHWTGPVCLHRDKGMLGELKLVKSLQISLEGILVPSDLNEAV